MRLVRTWPIFVAGDLPGHDACPIRLHAPRLALEKKPEPVGSVRVLTQNAPNPCSRPPSIPSSRLLQNPIARHSNLRKADTRERTVLPPALRPRAAVEST